MFYPINKTEDLLLSITKNCQVLIHQTHTKSQETLKFKLTKPKDTLSFKTSISLGHDYNWMVGLTGLEIYNSFLKTTRENNKLEFHADNFDEFFICRIKRSA